MDNDESFENLQEVKNTSSNSKLDKILKIEEQPEQRVISGRNETDISSSIKSQNKFDLPSFKCKECPYESIWKHAVKRHQQTHYRGQDVPVGSKKLKYKCETCSYTANNWTVLKDHQKLHVRSKTNSKTETLQNEEDSSDIDETKQKRKRLEEDGYNHEQQELNKPTLYTCKKCNYSTSYKVVFENHKKVHLKKNEVITYPCDQCNFKSVYRQSFLRHIKEIHENEASNGNYVLKCDYCGVTSDCEERFEQHLKRHHQAKDNTGAKDVQSQNNNISQELSISVKPRQIICSTTAQIVSSQPTDKAIQRPTRVTRRGKYSDVPVKTTKNGLFECEHCSYQTAIRTALVKHQTNHLKNANS